MDDETYDSVIEKPTREEPLPLDVAQFLNELYKKPIKIKKPVPEKRSIE